MSLLSSVRRISTACGTLGEFMDMSDRAMAERWGHILNEIPELWDAIRIYEIQSRPEKSTFRVCGDAGVSMQSGAGSELRIRIGRA